MRGIHGRLLAVRINVLMSAWAQSRHAEKRNLCRYWG